MNKPDVTRLGLSMALVACWGFSPAFAQSSLFFTSEEIHAVEALADAGKTSAEDSASTEISLEAIIYYGPRDWKIWLQGEPWTKETSRPGLRVLNVTPNRVLLEVGEISPLRITLKPHQTWANGDEGVLEGAP